MFRLATAAARIGRERGKTSSLSALQDPPTITPTAPLANTISLLERAARTERGARRHRTVVAAIKPPPEEADPAPLDRFIQRFTQAHASATALRGRLDQVSAELNNVTGQVRAWLQNNPTCPLCGGATDLEHVLAGGHHHG